jgi:glutathione peroxidase
MWIPVTLAAALAIAYYHFADILYPRVSAFDKETSIFNFTVDRVDDGQPISLSKFKGKKAYLVVNVASQCGLTNKNYAELQQVYEKYRFLLFFVTDVFHVSTPFSPQGLEILAFPCDNFGHQEPDENLNILNFARETKQATFPVLGKLECDNREKTHSLYQFLKTSLSGGILGSGLKWNFAKFLCDKEGRPVKRYLPIANPLSLEKDIAELLQSQQ